MVWFGSRVSCPARALGLRLLLQQDDLGVDLDLHQDAAGSGSLLATRRWSDFF